jgi:hypothetical protein
LGSCLVLQQLPGPQTYVFIGMEHAARVVV